MPKASMGTGRSFDPSEVEEVSVYVHIPFCSSRCNYCDFYFETTRSPQVIRATLERILEEAEYFITSMAHPRIRSVYFGGGTPSVVPPELLDPFLGRLRAILFDGREQSEPLLPADFEVEWSFEANPESITADLLEVLAANGVNRLSLGVQSFDDRLLRALTRRADHATVVGALEKIAEKRRKGLLPGLNLDLITGIPGQTPQMLDADIKQALDFGVDHFSVYSLTVEEHTPLRQAVDRRLRVLPTPERQDRLWLHARDRILETGFEWYEISNFARPGRRSSHNLGYWRLDPYLGLGPGGVSTVPVSPGGGDPVRTARLTNPNLFIYGSRFERGWHHSVELLEPEALLLEHFITGLRTSEGVSFARLERIFSLPLRRLWSARLADWSARGIAEREPLSAESPRLVLAPGARLLLDHHLLEIDGWIDELAELGPPAWPDRVNVAG